MLINKKNTHTHTESVREIKHPLYKIHTKWNSHNTIKYPQYKVILMCVVLSYPRSSPQLTSLQNKITSHEITPLYFCTRLIALCCLVRLFMSNMLTLSLWKIFYSHACKPCISVTCIICDLGLYFCNERYILHLLQTESVQFNLLALEFGI